VFFFGLTSHSCRETLHDPAAAHNIVAFIKHGCLSRRDAVDAVVEAGYDLVGAGLFDERRGAVVFVAHFGDGFQRLLDRCVFLKIQFAHIHAVAEKVGHVAEHDFVGIFPYLCHENRAT